MRLYKERYTDKAGKRQKTQKWYIDFTDHFGRRHRTPGFTEKRSTQALGENIKALVSCKVAHQRPDVELQRWLEGVSGCPDEEAGLLGAPGQSEDEGWKAAIGTP